MTAMKNTFNASNSDLHIEDLLNRGQLAGIVLSIDLWNETIDIDSHFQTNSTSGLEWHGHEKTYPLSWLFDADQGRDWIDEVVKPLADQLLKEYESEWDGSNNVARFTDRGREILEELHHVIMEDQNAQPELPDVQFFSDYLRDCDDAEDEDIKNLPDEKSVRLYARDAWCWAEGWIVETQEEAEEVALDYWRDLTDED